MRRYLDREFPTRHGKMSSFNSVEMYKADMRYGGHIQSLAGSSGIAVKQEYFVLYRVCQLTL